jgi:ribosomal protein S12 methylthiotransferase accessory factor
VQARLDALAATGCAVSLQRLESPWACVALVAAQHEQLHFTTMATAAHATFWEAAAGAVDEIEARVYAWLHSQKPTVRSPADVVTPDHHFELYGLARYFRRADRVLFPDDVPGPVDVSRHPAAESAAALVANFASRGIHPVAVDITPRQCFIDQGRTALTVVKAMVPGLIPVSFGHRREPLGMMRTFYRAATFPHPFP